jgi:hypothetical protein
MADTTTKGHKEAVEAVAGQADPDEIQTTRDLASEQAKDAKLDEEAGGVAGVFTASLGSEEQEQLAVHTLENGKTEALLREPDALPTFPPDDGGYNPEKRVFAGPDGTKVPSAVGKNTPAQGDSNSPFKPSDYTKAGKEEFGIK